MSTHSLESMAIAPAKRGKDSSKDCHFYETMLELSVQPTVDAKDLSERQYKLALAVGKSRHYQVDEIVPRHLLQTAKQAGFEDAAATAMLDELYDTANERMALVTNSLPNAIPGRLVTSICAGVERRLNAVRLWRQAT